MADFVSHLDTLPTGLAQPEVLANRLFNLLSPASLFGIRDGTSASLTLGISGGVLLIAGVPTTITNTTVLLTASSTNYVEATTAGAVSSNTSAFTGGRIQLYVVTTNATGITNSIDKRYSALGLVLTGGAPGTVTSVDAASGVETIAGTPITTTGTIRGKETVNNQTGTSYAILDGDRAKLVTISNGSSIAVTIAQAGAASSFLAGWFVDVQNRGAGLVTITPTTSTVDGAASLTLATDQGVRLVSDGSNYFTAGRGRITTSAALPVVDTTSIVEGSGDATKELRIEVDGVTTGTIRVWTVQNADITVAGLNIQQAYTANQRVTPSTLTDGANIAVDAALSNNFKVTLGGNRTLDNPSNLSDGMVLNFVIKQDGTGTRTLAYGSKYSFEGGTAPVLSTPASSKDFMSCYYDSVADELFCNMTKAYS